MRLIDLGFQDGYLDLIQEDQRIYYNRMEQNLALLCPIHFLFRPSETKCNVPELNDESKKAKEESR